MLDASRGGFFKWELCQTGTCSNRIGSEARKTPEVNRKGESDQSFPYSTRLHSTEASPLVNWVQSLIGRLSRGLVLAIKPKDPPEGLRYASGELARLG